MDYSFEEMSEEHRTGVVDIFNYYIENSFAAYPEEPFNYDFFDRFMAMACNYPSAVVKDVSGEIVGFAFLHPFHSISTFSKTAMITYFIMPEHTGKGLGSAILEKFIEEAKKKGIKIIMANLSSENKGSMNFHLKKGFRECGRFKKIGRKFGKNFDFITMQLDL